VDIHLKVRNYGGYDLPRRGSNGYYVEKTGKWLRAAIPLWPPAQRRKKANHYQPAKNRRGAKKKNLRKEVARIKWIVLEVRQLRDLRDFDVAGRTGRACIENHGSSRCATSEPEYGQGVLRSRPLR